MTLTRATVDAVVAELEDVAGLAERYGVSPGTVKGSWLRTARDRFGAPFPAPVLVRGQRKHLWWVAETDRWLANLRAPQYPRAT